MSQSRDLSGALNSRLPVELTDIMRRAGQVAHRRHLTLYLVGGVVRDVLLEKENLDLDFVVDRDAIGLAQELGAIVHARVTTHARFNTAKLRWDGWSADVATVRSETYDRPGALPRVGPGTLATDLFRRDFTINAMAIELTSGRYGKLIDLYGGLADLERRQVRVLHEKSFVDDPTRMWRAVRYEQRLGFHLERRTSRLLKRDLAVLDTVSGDRIRHELELILQEERPEKALTRAAELGILARLRPPLQADAWLAIKLRQARKLKKAEPLTAVYLALLAYRLSDVEAQELIRFLRLPRQAARFLVDTVALRSSLGTLVQPALKRSQLYYLLKDYSPAAVHANLVVTDSPKVRRRLTMYLEELRFVKNDVTGRDLIAMDINPGPRMKEVLQLLLDARLNGRVRNKKEELEMVRAYERRVPPGSARERLTYPTAGHLREVPKAE